MGDLILIPLVFGCLVAVVVIIRGYVSWSFANDPHTKFANDPHTKFDNDLHAKFDNDLHAKFDKNAAFEDWYVDECWIAASELVGPNSPEYDALIDKLLADDVRKAAARKFYDGMA